MFTPDNLKSVIGQKRQVATLQILISASKQREMPIGHTLLLGRSGLGKTTLSRLVAKELNSDIIEISADQIKSPEHLYEKVSGITENGILFIDEIHCLKIPQECLFNLMCDKPCIPSQKTNDGLFKELGIKQESSTELTYLPSFSIFAASTEAHMICPALLSRFTNTIKLNPYTANELAEIIKLASQANNFNFSDKIALNIANRSRSSARTAINLTEWITSYLTGTKQSPTLKALNEAFELKGISTNGLNADDFALLELLISSNSPMGIDNLSICLSEHPSAIRNQLSFLIQSNLVKRTSRGIVATDKAMEEIQKEGVLV
jgi:Holliday junction DNA helicase RuvB